MSGRKKGYSKYILGQVGYTQIAAMPIGGQAVVVLNPDEPNALARASAQFKASFSVLKKTCLIDSQLILISAEPGVWKESRIITITVVEKESKA